MKTYDLNIYRQDDGVNGEYQDPWYIEVYEHSQVGDIDTHHSVQRVELTAEETAKLQLGTSEYFADNDVWYGFDSFIEDFEHQISNRLWDIINALPRLENN